MIMNLGFYKSITTTQNNNNNTITGKLSTHDYNNNINNNNKKRKKINSSSLLVLSSPMAPKKMKKKRRREAIAIAIPSIYKEDLGTEGTKHVTRLSGPSTSTLSTSTLSFRLQEDKKEEERKRRQRMERFGATATTTTSKDKERHDQSNSNNVEESGEPEGMFCALSSARRSYEGEQIKKNNNNNNNNLSNTTTTTKLVGTSTALEKPYLRLTTFPKPENVRPLHVLIKCLAHIKSQFILKEDFDWANEQMKSVRQDITVQGLRNKFVLDVYETHSRILLEHGDLNEFHQCQTMIRNLTSPTKLVGYDDDDDDDDGENEEFGNGDFSSSTSPSDGGDGGGNYLKQSEEASDEFQAYSILYNLVQNNWGEMTRALTGASSYNNNNNNDTTETSSVMSSSDSDRHQQQKHQQSRTVLSARRGSSRRHALKVVKCVVHDDYKSFFRLYETAPHMSAYLMDFLVRRVRDGAYKRIVAAYRPTLSVEHFREALHFDDLEETRRFLKKNGAKFIQEQGGGPPFWVDCKSTVSSLVVSKED